MLKKFLRDLSGVTVDWVVITAAIVGLGLAVITSIRTDARLEPTNGVATPTSSTTP